jgi:hypothetical protein
VVVVYENPLVQVELLDIHAGQQLEQLESGVDQGGVALALGLAVQHLDQQH